VPKSSAMSVFAFERTCTARPATTAATRKNSS
jgi:hypothetical protein